MRDFLIHLLGGFTQKDMVLSGHRSEMLRNDLRQTKEKLQRANLKIESARRNGARV